MHILLMALLVICSISPAQAVDRVPLSPDEMRQCFTAIGLKEGPTGQYDIVQDPVHPHIVHPKVDDILIPKASQAQIACETAKAERIKKRATTQAAAPS